MNTPTGTIFPGISAFSSLANTGIMVWDEAPANGPGSNISLIPYVSTGVAKNYEEGTPTELAQRTWW